MADQTAKIEWREGAIPVSVQFSDPYFSMQDGLAETRHVYLGGNNLPARFNPGFHIAELGFGTGLNMLTAWDAWNKSDQNGPLHFTSFEQYPMATPDMEIALTAFPELATLSDEFMSNWSPDSREIHLSGLELRIVHGDARQTLPDWGGTGDAWFLDGFSPAKNPELWAAPLMQQVAGHTAQNGTFATYTAAGHVRRALADAGFSVTRCPGYGRKRHMTTGTLKPAP